MASGSRNSGNTAGPSASSSIVSGRGTRKTDPHQNLSSNAPPSSGARSPPSRETGCPQPERGGPLAGIGEHTADQRQGGRHQRRTGQPISTRARMSRAAVSAKAAGW